MNIIMKKCVEKHYHIKEGFFGTRTLEDREDFHYEEFTRIPSPELKVGEKYTIDGVQFEVLESVVDLKNGDTTYYTTIEEFEENFEEKFTTMKELFEGILESKQGQVESLREEIFKLKKQRPLWRRITEKLKGY